MTTEMKVPTLKECYELFDQYKVPGTIRAHCGMVFQVATSLAQQLIQQGYTLNLEIVKPFALLHDFMKVVVLERLDSPPYNYKPSAEELEMHKTLRAKYKGHSETFVTNIILKEKYPAFAQLFLELDGITANPNAKVCEETRFIHYVDWRVLGNKVVPLKQRMEYIHERYGHWFQKKGINWPEAQRGQYEYEENIFHYLSYTADELDKHIQLQEVVN